MATIDETLQMINDLINDDGAIDIPGLDLEPVVENFVDAKYAKELAQIEDVDERKKTREKWIDYYKKGDGKSVIQLEISNIKASVKAAIDQVKAVGEAAKSIVKNTVSPQPAVITVGEATSTSNPAYVAEENSAKKKQLLAMLKTVGMFIVNALRSMLAILFPIPELVIQLIQTLKITKQTVNAIKDIADI